MLPYHVHRRKAASADCLLKSGKAIDGVRVPVESAPSYVHTQQHKRQSSKTCQVAHLSFQALHPADYELVQAHRSDTCVQQHENACQLR